MTGMPRRADRPLLICPACEPTHGGLARIGNRKSTCPLCNRFAQKVRRQVAADLTRAYPAQADAYRARAEQAAHAEILTQYATPSTP